MDYGAHWDYSLIDVWFEQKLDLLYLQSWIWTGIIESMSMTHVHIFWNRNNFQYF